jgi:hypothetical protein
MRRLFSGIIFLLFAHVLRAQSPPLVVVEPSGPLQTVFRWQTDKCTVDDIPDDGARAFRDLNGTVHLIASHYINWAFTGKDLLDEHSPTRNFETVGASAYIYTSQFHGCGNMNRDLVRLPVPLQEK